MAFRLAGVWAHPYQAHLSSLDEAAKKLTLLISLGNNWAYAFVQLNGDAQHVPIPKEGHLITMIDGTPSRNACRHLCQLEVHNLSQYGDHVVYPEGLNGSLELVQTSLSGPLLWGQDALDDSTHEPSFLLVGLSQVTLGYYMPKAPAPHRTSTLSSPTHLAMEYLPKTYSHICMTSEVQELLSWAMLDTSTQALGDSTPERLMSAALGASPSARTEDSSMPVATSSQLSLRLAMPEDAVPISQAPKVASTPTSPTNKNSFWG